MSANIDHIIMFNSELGHATLACTKDAEKKPISSLWAQTQCAAIMGLRSAIPPNSIFYQAASIFAPEGDKISPDMHVIFCDGSDPNVSMVHYSIL